MCNHITHGIKCLHILQYARCTSEPVSKGLELSKYSHTTVIYTLVVSMWVLWCWPTAGSPRSCKRVYGVYTYMALPMERTWGWGRSDYLSQRIFLSTYLVCLCGGECSRSRMLESTPGNTWYLVPWLTFGTFIFQMFPSMTMREHMNFQSVRRKSRWCTAVQ